MLSVISILLCFFMSYSENVSSMRIDNKNVLFINHNAKYYSPTIKKDIESHIVSNKDSEHKKYNALKKDTFKINLFIKNKENNIEISEFQIGYNGIFLLNLKKTRDLELIVKIILNYRFANFLTQLESDYIQDMLFIAKQIKKNYKINIKNDLMKPNSK